MTEYWPLLLAIGWLGLGLTVWLCEEQEEKLEEINRRSSKIVDKFQRSF